MREKDGTLDAGEQGSWGGGDLFRKKYWELNGGTEKQEFWSHGNGKEIKKSQNVGM